METTRCNECQAEWQAGQTCQDHFYQMLFWESENSSYWVVHQLMVLCYYLQHPSLYSPAGVQEGMRLLVGFVDEGRTTRQVRRENRERLSSHNRTEKITARSGAQGSYAHPVAWQMTAADVVAGGAAGYVENVRAWARTMREDLKKSGNLP